MSQPWLVEPHVAVIVRTSAGYTSTLYSEVYESYLYVGHVFGQVFRCILIRLLGISEAWRGPILDYGSP